MFTPTPDINLEVVAAEVAHFAWFHSFELFPGLRTKGRDVTERKLTALNLPNLEGKTVLDIGACDGFFSFEAERLGAARVVAVDDFTWTPPHDESRRCFDFLHRTLHSQVVARYLPMLEIAPQTVGTFDVVFALGVLYHLDDPVDWLSKVRSVTASKGMAVVETLVDCLDLPRPACAYYKGSDLGKDRSNRFGPNKLAVMAMLEDAGFRRILPFECWHTDTVQTTGYTWPQPPGSSGRMVFHAYPE